MATLHKHHYLPWHSIYSVKAFIMKPLVEIIVIGGGVVAATVVATVVVAIVYCQSRSPMT